MDERVKELLEVERNLRALKKRSAELRADLLVEMRRDLEERGVAPSWRVKEGAVILVAPEPQMTIVNEYLLVKHLIEDGHEDWLVQRVDAVHAAGLLAACEEDGELLPGVEMVERLPFIAVRTT